VKSGILVVDKAAGSTSFDVVVLARRVLRVRRVGHGGTLDPAAVGVLPILIGEATKLTPYLTEQDKEYRVTIRLGVTTDTHDLTGRVVAESAVPPLTTAMVATAARAFVGRIRQVPPMYSAVHHGGRRLYELARAGREVPRAAREVTVDAPRRLRQGNVRSCPRRRARRRPRRRRRRRATRPHPRRPVRAGRRATVGAADGGGAGHGVGAGAASGGGAAGLAARPARCRGGRGVRARAGRRGRDRRR
jgi:tRNA pseudouridine(55) synthase